MTVASPDDVSIVAGVNEKSTNFGAFPSCTKFTTGLGVGVAVAVGPDVAGGAGSGVTVGVGTTVGADATASGVSDIVASGAGVAVGGTSYGAISRVISASPVNLSDARVLFSVSVPPQTIW
jgi:hypothetical protein